MSIRQTLKRHGLFLTALCLGIAGGTLIGLYIRSARLEAPNFNVLFVTIDTLRADHLGCYGYGPPTSPAIDAVARSGAVFENAFAQRSLTWPSLASIMTSTYPHLHGVRSQGQLLDGTLPTLATVLREKGYETACFTANCSGQNWRGFRHQEAFNIGGDAERGIEAAPEAGSRLTDSVIRWIKEREDGKFFAWAHYIAPHADYEPPEEFRRRFDAGYAGPYDGALETLESIAMNKVVLNRADLKHIISLYDGEIAHMDHEFGRLVALLEEEGLLDNTLIVFSADHGEDLYERHFYFGHSPSAYDSSLRIPLIFHLPGTVDAGARIVPIVESIDIAPTILDILDYESPGEFVGRSCLRLIHGEDVPKRTHAVAELWGEGLTLRTDRRRYIYNPSNAMPLWTDNLAATYPVAREELYDFQTDDYEKTNVADDEPEMAGRLNAEVLRWIEAHGWFPNENRPAPETLDPAVREELQALGYLE